MHIKLLNLDIVKPNLHGISSDQNREYFQYDDITAKSEVLPDECADKWRERSIHVAADKYLKSFNSIKDNFVMNV